MQFQSITGKIMGDTVGVLLSQWDAEAFMIVWKWTTGEMLTV